ncbi:Uncharacterised protein r2_g235 [Pycnogonum litorale]
MPDTCCAINCNNDRDSGVSLYRIPADPERSNRWIAAIRRDKWEHNKWTRLCSQHFISGAKSDDPLSPDWIPSIFSFTTTPEKAKKRITIEAYNRRVKSKKTRKVTQEHVPNEIKKSDESEETFIDVRDMPTREMGTQTDMTGSDIDSIVTECKQLRNENLALKELKDRIKFDFDVFRDNDEKVCQFTGISSFAVLVAVFNYIKSHLKNKCLSPEQQFVMTLMRIRLNISPYILAHIYGVHRTTVSRIFFDVIEIINGKLVPTLLFWPDREVIRQSLPTSFRKLYNNCVSIIDCFELFIDRPSDLRARAQTYSNYKSHNTIKYLISITPQGQISYLSRGWGGRTSDKYLTEHCDYLHFIRPGDVILADRGFTIKESVALRRATLDVPAFTKGKEQLSPEEVEESREIANVRIHVERVIGRLRQKYTMLDGTLPITFLQNDGNLTNLDKIVQVAAALCNLCPPIVNKD